MNQHERSVIPLLVKVRDQQPLHQAQLSLRVTPPKPPRGRTHVDLLPAGGHVAVETLVTERTLALAASKVLALLLGEGQLVLGEQTLFLLRRLYPEPRRTYVVRRLTTLGTRPTRDTSSTGQ